MDMLGQLFGGTQQRQQFDDFANRYEQGDPWDGISDNEALDHYGRIAPNIPQDVYQRSAEQSFSRLSPQQRMELGRYMVQRAPQYGVQFPDYNQDGVDDRLQDPSELASMSSRIEEHQPGLLGQLLGGMGGSSRGAGGMLASPIAKAALGGIAAMAVRQVMARR